MSSDSLEKLYQRIKKAYPDKRLVFGDGDKAAPVLLIGEAPGKDEVEAGRPFVGKAGKNLDRFLEEIALSRTDFYVTNVCKFRPTKISAKQTVSNRPPTKDEVIFAQPFLIEEIGLLAPKVIVTLGNTPLRAVTNERATIGDVHGKQIKITLNKKEYALFALYHPASIIYNPSLRLVCEQDMKMLRACLENIL